MNPIDPLHHPLSLEELGKLENFLSSGSMPAESLSSLSMVDGYMTALIAGPDEVQPDIWIPYIWNEGKSGQSCFSSDAEAELIRQFLVRHMQTIAQQFLNNPDGFRPLFATSSYKNKKAKELAIEQWAQGFTMGMELAHESWKPLFADEETGMLAMPMLLLGKITDDYDSLSKDDIADMIELLPDFVIKIYKYWKQHKQ
jgi:uncharacterized protein